MIFGGYAIGPLMHFINIHTNDIILSSQRLVFSTSLSMVAKTNGLVYSFGGWYGSRITKWQYHSPPTPEPSIDHTISPTDEPTPIPDFFDSILHAIPIYHVQFYVIQFMPVKELLLIVLPINCVILFAAVQTHAVLSTSILLRIPLFLIYNGVVEMHWLMLNIPLFLMTIKS